MDYWLLIINSRANGILLLPFAIFYPSYQQQNFFIYNRKILTFRLLCGFRVFLTSERFWKICKPIFVSSVKPYQAQTLSILFQYPVLARSHRPIKCSVKCGEHALAKKVFFLLLKIENLDGPPLPRTPVSTGLLAAIPLDCDTFCLIFSPVDGVRYLLQRW